jgi:hypothetical protein
MSVQPAVDYVTVMKDLEARAERAEAKLATVLKLHSRQETPVRSYDLDLRCASHRTMPLATTAIPFDEIRDCPDCTYRETHPCTHCREDDWPCPTVQAINGEDGKP